MAEGPCYVACKQGQPVIPAWTVCLFDFVHDDIAHASAFSRPSNLRAKLSKSVVTPLLLCSARCRWSLHPCQGLLSRRSLPPRSLPGRCPLCPRLLPRPPRLPRLHPSLLRQRPHLPQGWSQVCLKFTLILTQSCIVRPPFIPTWQQPAALEAPGSHSWSQACLRATQSFAYDCI